MVFRLALQREWNSAFWMASQGWCCMARRLITAMFPAHHPHWMWPSGESFDHLRFSFSLPLSHGDFFPSVPFPVHFCAVSLGL